MQDGLTERARQDRHEAGVRLTGVGIAAGALIVLTGWLLDVAPARSLVPGWRVTVPSTAICFAFLGAALAIAGRGRPRLAAVTSLVLATAAGFIAAATLREYAVGVRSGLESWGGVWAFQGPYDGRMSPMAATLLLVCAVSVGASVLEGRRAYLIARLTASTALFASWLAVMALAVDAGRLSDEPRFPGMGAPTLLLAALTAVAALSLSGSRRPSSLRWPRWSIAAAFLAPPLLRQLHALLASTGLVDPQLLTALVAFGFAGLLAVTAYSYSSRLSHAVRALDDARSRLEERVRERTLELSASNDDLRQHQETLREADRRKDEFLAQLAHELRNPLAPIRTAAHIVGAEKATGEQQRRAAVIIERQVAVMRRLIDDLLDVSRITAGRLQLRTTRIPLAEVIDLAVATASPGCDDAGHQVTISVPDTPLHVEADAARLAQAIGNLLHNACKFTPPHGNISLTARAIDGGFAEIAVQDDGSGIEPAFLPYLFDKFSQQARPGTGRAQGGLGLGLSLVLGIVTLHGGTVTAESDGPGKGSRFIVRLPLLPAHEGVVAAPDIPGPALVRRTILVVDDNEDNANALSAVLSLDGHDVHTAHSGTQALLLADRVRPQAMLIDIGMPDMDGLEVCRRVRGTPWGVAALLIAQTGFGRSRDLARTRDAGFDWHLTKPIDIRQVRELLLAHPPLSPSSGVRLPAPATVSVPAHVRES